MSLKAPSILLQLAGQSLLRNEALAISALEKLPMELFPPVFMEAFIRIHEGHGAGLALPLPPPGSPDKDKRPGHLTGHSGWD
jgi:hypothetical protein